jgi:hypothetical protein
LFVLLLMLLLLSMVVAATGATPEQYEDNTSTKPAQPTLQAAEKSGDSLALFQ